MSNTMVSVDKTVFNMQIFNKFIILLINIPFFIYQEAYLNDKINNCAKHTPPSERVRINHSPDSATVCNAYTDVSLTDL